jgi:hypothetical protein
MVRDQRHYRPVNRTNITGQIALARQSALDRGQDNETAGTAAPFLKPV